MSKRFELRDKRDNPTVKWKDAGQEETSERKPSVCKHSSLEWEAVEFNDCSVKAVGPRREITYPVRKNQRPLHSGLSGAQPQAQRKGFGD